MDGHNYLAPIKEERSLLSLSRARARVKLAKENRFMVRRWKPIVEENGWKIRPNSLERNFKISFDPYFQNELFPKFDSP